MDERRYQVFVSSTFKDLEAERRKVLEAILELRAFPSGMELFPSADDEQWEFIKREIDSSDYYVVIVAGRYGSLAQDEISFTEKEYDYAVERKKYVIGFLVKDVDELKGKLLESDPKQRKLLELFRAKVGKNRLVKFYTNPDELKSQAYQALSHAFQLSPREGWVRASQGRRMEDLEKVIGLQTKINELEEEMSTLKSHDLRSDLSQGIDVIELQVQEEHFSWTWDQLLAGLFGESITVDPIFKLAKLIAPHSYGATFSSHHALLQEFVQKVRVQFDGLGYIDYDHNGRDITSWRLTAAGKLRLALAAGQRRKSD